MNINVLNNEYDVIGGTPKQANRIVQSRNK